MGTSLLSLSFVATADHCDFCRKEYEYDAGHVCQYDGAQTEDVHNRNRYFWNKYNWRDFGEFLDAEEAIRNLIDERCIDDSAALAVQDVLIGNGRRYGFGWDRLNVPTGEMEFLGVDVPGSFVDDPAGRLARANSLNVIKSIAEHVRTPQQALDIDWAIDRAVNAAIRPNSPLVGRFYWHKQSPFRVIASYSFFKYVNCPFPAWDCFQKEPRLRPSPEDGGFCYLQRQLKICGLAKEWYDSHRAEPGLNYGLDYFIRDMRFDITNQRSADGVNTILCLIAERYDFPWVNRNHRIENFNLEDAESSYFLDNLFGGISSIEDLLRVDNAMKAESTRGGRFVWHAQGDAAAAQADQ